MVVALVKPRDNGRKHGRPLPPCYPVLSPRHRTARSLDAGNSCKTCRLPRGRKTFCRLHFKILDARTLARVCESTRSLFRTTSWKRERERKRSTLQNWGLFFYPDCTTARAYYRLITLTATAVINTFIFRELSGDDVPHVQSRVFRAPILQKTARTLRVTRVTEWRCNM